ncbi:LAMI_0G05556g1_1 [Lachancea mirantina]|uniref:LAMI_0G05556g1_1 n=1 Tax=Lachancea mirantina TaxID=1230905 RepID=A0A1G4K8U5_9SACH|nr:LAMI_0G05556g1_1 [Lachancea mirantina]
MDRETDPLLAPAISPIINDHVDEVDRQEQLKSKSVLSSSRVFAIIFALFTGSFLSAMDMTLVATLMPTIASELDASSQMSWIATSYLLSCSAFQPLYGKLSDIFGRKAMLVWSNLVFAFGCFCCGSPWTNDIWTLAAGRFIAGIGGGGLTALSTIAVSDIVPLRRRGVYQGLGNICFSVGCASGSVLGAVFQQSIGWRWAFLIQVPAAIVSGFLVFTVLKLPSNSPGRGTVFLERDQGNNLNAGQIAAKIDFKGSFYLVMCMLILMVVITKVSDVSQLLSSPSFYVSVCALAVLFPLFVKAEMATSNPIIPLHLLWENRTVLASSLTNWFCTMATFAMMYFVPVFWQSVYRFDSWNIGIRSISNFAGISIGSLGSGLYMRRTGQYWNFNMVLQSIYVLGIIIIFSSSFSSKPHGALDYVLMFLPGLGYASMLTVTLLALIASVDFQHQAQVTSIQYAFRATGSTLGVSLAGALYQWGLNHKLDRLILKDDELLERYGSQKLLRWCSEIVNDNLFDISFDERLSKLAHKSFMFSSETALAFAVVAALSGLVCSLFIREHKLLGSVSSSK